MFFSELIEAIEKLKEHIDDFDTKSDIMKVNLFVTGDDGVSYTQELNGIRVEYGGHTFSNESGHEVLEPCVVLEAFI